MVRGPDNQPVQWILQSVFDTMACCDFFGLPGGGSFQSKNVNHSCWNRLIWWTPAIDCEIRSSPTSQRKSQCSVRKDKRKKSAPTSWAAGCWWLLTTAKVLMDNMLTHRVNFPVKNGFAVWNGNLHFCSCSTGCPFKRMLHSICEPSLCPRKLYTPQAHSEVFNIGHAVYSKPYKNKLSPIWRFHKV